MGREPPTIALHGRVALVQPRVGIGDMVWHLPHLRALARLATGPVTLVTRPRSHADQLVGAEDGIADIFWVERDQWLPDGRHQGVTGMARLVAQLRARRFDTAVLLTRSRAFALAAFGAGIPARYGYGIGNQRWLLNRRPYLPEPLWKGHPHAQAGAWLEAAGVALPDAEPRMLVPAGAGRAARDRLGLGDLPLIALGIASSDAWKKWPPAHFAALIRGLPQQGWPALVLVGGPAEAADAAAVLSHLGAEQAARVLPVLDWPLRDVAALLSEAQIYVGNDTAALNIAAAVGTPAIGLFGATPALQHSPKIRPIVPPGGGYDRDGMATITPEAVLGTVLAELGP